MLERVSNKQTNPPSFVNPPLCRFDPPEHQMQNRSLITFSFLIHSFIAPPWLISPLLLIQHVNTFPCSATALSFHINRHFYSTSSKRKKMPVSPVHIQELAEEIGGYLYARVTWPAVCKCASLGKTPLPHCSIDMLPMATVIPAILSPHGQESNDTVVTSERSPSLQVTFHK